MCYMKLVAINNEPKNIYPPTLQFLSSQQDILANTR